jgi:hypothetical protein
MGARAAADDADLIAAESYVRRVMDLRLPSLLQAIERASSGARHALGAHAHAQAQVAGGRARRPRRRAAAVGLAVVMLGALVFVAAVAAAGSTPSGEAFVQAGSKLTATGEAPAGQLGASAALSGDGATLIVGATKDDGGAAYVFLRKEESQSQQPTWSQQARLTPGEVASGEGETTCTAGNCPGEECGEEVPAGEAGEECAFGASVAVSADGDTALVGDPSPNATPGSAWVFARSAGGSWSRTAVLVGDVLPHEGRFGRSVALSADGTTALVGDPSGESGHGKAWVFTREGATWKRHLALSGPQETSFAHLGRSVALSGDGTTALLGGPGADEGAGAVRVFTESGGDWAQQGATLTMPGGAAGDHFGRSVALSSDGSTALIGAPDADGEQGVAATSVRSGAGFAQLGPRIVQGLGEGEDHFGASVALSGDANEALIGAPFTDQGTGTVARLTGSPVEWAGASEGLAGSEALGKGWRGAAVALSSDGRVAAIGAPRDHQRAGAAWVFERRPPASVPTPVVSPEDPRPTGQRVTSGAKGGASGGVLGFATSAASDCRVSLAKKRLAVTRYRSVALRLVRTGSGPCRGSVALVYRVAAKGRFYAMRTIGTASFSIPSGTSRVVTVKLNKAGQRWLRAHHGNAGASLAIARVVPTPTFAQTASVRLSVKKVRRASTVKR